MPRHCQRSEHQIRLQRNNAFDIDLQVRADTRQARDNLGRVVTMIIDAHEQIGATEGSHDLGVRTS
jgi:hypothetical protein